MPKFAMRFRFQRQNERTLRIAGMAAVRRKKERREELRQAILDERRRSRRGAALDVATPVIGAPRNAS